MSPAPPRIGIDLGGTKIEGTILSPEGTALTTIRMATPRDPSPDAAYAATLAGLADLVTRLEAAAACTIGHASVGIGMPGSMSPATGRVQNANSVWLNGRRFREDVEQRLARPVRFANDANCFAVSEATDGAGAGFPTVFGVILGTGCGGGIVVNGRLVDGPRGIGGEWGHTPLPWASADEHPGPLCWCGRLGCMETWVSGTALAADHTRATGRAWRAEAIVEAVATGDPGAKAALERHATRLARGLAQVVNIIDPHVIVLGGGLSALGHLYECLPALMTPYIFADHATIDIRPPRWGDASGVRGAAWLWPA